MSHPTFIKGLQSFSRVLSQIPQDDLPTDFIDEATHLLDFMRNDPGKVVFGMQQGEQIIPNQSNLALGATLVWQHAWNADHPKKALWIDVQITAEEETPNLHKAFDYLEERDLFVANQMVGFLENQKQPIPDELRAFIGGRHGSLEGE
jgi:hypothetical protein